MKVPHGEKGKRLVLDGSQGVSALLSLQCAGLHDAKLDETRYARSAMTRNFRVTFCLHGMLDAAEVLVVSTASHPRW